VRLVQARHHLAAALYFACSSLTLPPSFNFAASAYASEQYFGEKRTGPLAGGLVASKIWIPGRSSGNTLFARGETGRAKSSRLGKAGRDASARQLFSAALAANFFHSFSLRTKIPTFASCVTLLWWNRMRLTPANLL
jgi:hypothetical protein